MQSNSFQEALNTLVSLGAERVLVLEGPLPFKVRAAYGIVEHQPWTEQVSMELLESTIQEGSPVFLADVQGSPLADRWSLMLNSVRSLLCVPFWSPSSRIAGILYADTCSAAGIFSRKAVEAVQSCARQLEASLYGGRPTAASPVTPQVAPQGVLGLRPAAAAPVAPAPAARKPTPLPSKVGRVSQLSVTLFYRSLATMLSAGLPLSRGLSVLADHESDIGLRSILGQVSSKLQAGNPLSQSMSGYPRVFSKLYLQMIRVGEKSGSLEVVLRRVADHREKAQRVEMQLRHALLYPALILALCLVILVLGPPYLLQAQFSLIRASGQVPPWPTQIMMALSDLARSPLALAGMAGLAVVTGAALRRFTRYADWLRLAWQVPGLRQTLTHLLAARFSGTLALAYRVGIPITEATQLSIRSTQNPLLTQYEQEIADSLLQGAPLAQSLSLCPLFPSMFLRMLSSGEEVGKVDAMMDWVTSFYELELESSLQRLLLMIEPILLLGMGIMVGFILIATLLPMVSVLQTL